MDPFTQRLLEKAEQRSRALGISSTSGGKFPDIENRTNINKNTSSGACATTMASMQQQKPKHTITPFDGSSAKKGKLHVIEKQDKGSAVDSQKVLRQFSAVDKENMDLGIEINIVTDKNVEVQVEVEEEDLADDNLKNNQNTASEDSARPIAKIRDTSRNRLQRLGALYSNTDNLSSPIHRTEGKFHAECNEDDFNSQVRKPNHQRLGKLAALANTINQWEDDTSHHVLANNAMVVQPPPKLELPSRDKLIKEKQSSATDTVEKAYDKSMSTNKDKKTQLKWDPKVINSLEAQGFQRRDSSTVKVFYEFDKTKKCGIDVGAEETVCSVKSTEDGKKEGKFCGEKSNTNKFVSNSSESVTEKTNEQQEKRIANVKPGLVSGRAAIFECQAQRVQQQQMQQKPQKDPTELSLKERMKLFEKNKGEALIPKAAFGMAPPKSKIFQGNNKKGQVNAKTTSVANAVLPTKSNIPSVVLPVVKSTADSKVREKVRALVTATVENTVKEDIRKQREEDLQLLANRFNKQKDFLNNQQEFPTCSKSQNSEKKDSTPKLPPPPPPPLPIDVINFNCKRRSPINTIVDDKKRQRTSNQEIKPHLYPALSHFESTDCSDSDNENNWCTTASPLNTADEMSAVSQPLCNSNNIHNNVYDQVQGHDEDIEDSYMESEDEDSSVGIQNGSLGRQVMEVVQKNYKPDSNKPKGVHYADKDSYFESNTTETSTNSSDVSMGVDDYLDEALVEGDDDDTSQLSRDSKGTTTSNSFSFRKANVTGTYEESKKLSSATKACSPVTQAYKQPVKSELSVNKENENIVTLVHTVSFYRRQQTVNSASSTPIRKVCRDKQVLRSALSEVEAADGTLIHLSKKNLDTDNEATSDSEENDSNLAEEKIKKLLEEVCKQQQVMAQTSQALNLCAATIEFSGSTESVEGERHLLVATHRRQACLDEVQRLRVENTLHPCNAPCEKGILTVKDITIPLRQDYIRKLSLDTISGHHLVCLLKYNEQVIATKTVPTLPGLLSVKFPDVLQLNNVYADFKVTLEIYGMTAQREVLPHEVKYHINFNKKSGIKTPKKKGCENRLVMPPVQSPAGPHVVRTPALVQYGFAIFSLREIQRTSWTLTQVLGVSPLEGIVHMKVECELSISIQYKSFLTMYEDISGFGAWHRRWCHLNGTVLNYWKYPDDEKKKAPTGTIDLYSCSSPRIGIAPRDICARLNTILLECQRPSKESDQETLIIVPNGRTTTVRYLLSADTKEEREEWCAALNKSLSLLRAWGSAPQ